MYQYNHLEDYIRKFYSQLKIFRPSDLDFRRIAKDLNIKVFYWTHKSQALFLKGRAFIFLNMNLSFHQQYQEFMHELCHILFHAGDQMNMPPLFRVYQESKAKNFTLHACIPTFMLNDINLPRDINAATHVIQQTFNVEFDFAMSRLNLYINNHCFMPSWNTAN
ncbi:ImmA/IrrE family metallo-endopeptidase [Psychrobacillus sp. FSL K6-1464]|uniref:ImmA/IrrE family metallo-endopeptidase n=1 Tax=Psychrobacillus sp. FSL K6-1464 TaxID=2921545 RepID=UPI0030FA4AFC